MTIKEFADKYGIPYSIVYEATYKVPYISTMRKDREYPERELYKDTNRIITQRLEKHRKLFHQTQKMLISLKSIKRMDVMKCSARSAEEKPEPMTQDRSLETRIGAGNDV